MQPKDQSQLSNINLIFHVISLLIFYKFNRFQYLCYLEV